MLELLKVSQMVLSVLVVALVMLQPKDAGLTAAAAQSGGAKFERRGAAKTLHLATVAIVTLFVANSVAYFLLA